MEAKPDFNVRHFRPGRLRLAFPSLVSNKELTHRMEVHLSGGPGVTRVTANHYCGSITIYYDTQIAGKESFFEMLNNVTWETLDHLKDENSKGAEKKAIRKQVSKTSEEKSTWNLWTLAGSLFVGCGIIGIFLPLIPTVPFLLLAAFCYWKGSPKFYNWLINLGVVGKLIKDFREGKGIPARVKLHSIAYLWISLGISISFMVSNMVLRLILVLVGMGVTVYILRLKTAD